MKELGENFADALQQSQIGLAELYDVYLRGPIQTPWGQFQTLRLTDLPGGFDFYTPTFAPEPESTRGQPCSYVHWPIKRGMTETTGKFESEKFQITASNVSGDFADMVASIEWRDAPIVIRKVATGVAGLQPEDCAVIWSGSIDKVTITPQLVTFECSGDLASLSTYLPSWNFHSVCRFSWADDFCTAIRYHPDNWKTKVCGSGCTTTQIYSSDLTEDTGTKGSFGTDLVAALPNYRIYASSHRPSMRVRVYGFWPDEDWITIDESVDWRYEDKVAFDSCPPPLQPGVYYWVLPVHQPYIRVSQTYKGPPIDIQSWGGNTYLTRQSQEPWRVKAGQDGHWSFGETSDWGTLHAGFWRLQSDRAGLANPNLTPWISFDFGTAKAVRHWRFTQVSGEAISSYIKLITFFCAPAPGNWQHVGYGMLLPQPEAQSIMIPYAPAARYWRICIRSRWGPRLWYACFKTIEGYEGSRHYWRCGQIRFKDDTATAALRGKTAHVLESYAGEIKVTPLPVAPAAGDVFVISRGCARSFNACCERRNWENFGGFTDLPYVARTIV